MEPQVALCCGENCWPVVPSIIGPVNRWTSQAAKYFRIIFVFSYSFMRTGTWPPFFFFLFCHHKKLTRQSPPTVTIYQVRTIDMIHKRRWECQMTEQPRTKLGRGPLPKVYMTTDLYTRRKGGADNDDVGNRERQQAMQSRSRTRRREKWKNTTHNTNNIASKMSCPLGPCTMLLQVSINSIKYNTLFRQNPRTRLQYSTRSIDMIQQ